LTGSRARLASILVLLSAVLLGVIVSGCGGGRPAPREPESTLGLDEEDLGRAERLFVRLQREHDLHRDRQALDLAFELLDRYPSYPRRAEVVELAIDSAYRAGDTAAARRLIGDFRADFPASPRLPALLALDAELAEAAGDTLGAAASLVERYERLASGREREETRRELDRLLDALDSGALATLYADHAATQLGSYLGYRSVRSWVLAGRSERAERALAELRAAAPDDIWTDRAIELVQAPESARARGAPVPGVVVPGRVGVLCPLTGRYATLGNAFYDGVELALEQVQAASKDTQASLLELELVLEDSQADPVAAALAARRLCRDEGCVVVIGALLSAPTATAALVCDRYAVPLVSPTATHDRLGELGPRVFQTNQTESFETNLLARLVTSVLLKRRFAILYPYGRDGEASAEIFAEAVTRSGGEVVAQTSFAAEATDFRNAIAQIRRERPEAIYVPASVDQMVMLGPQLDFYHAGALVMGPSVWNSATLLERAGNVMQRAIFVSDVALFPAGWTHDFEDGWEGGIYPPEATSIALRGYRAARTVMEALLASPAPSRDDLATALAARLTLDTAEAEGPEAFARAVRMIDGDEIVPFPIDLYRESWRLMYAGEAAGSDSLSAAARADSLAGRAARADSLVESPPEPPGRAGSSF
jgi:branched-chain amino acid transport system substrate-binding protein